MRVLLMMALLAVGCGKKDDNDITGPCGGPESRGCLCADETQGTQTCDPETGQYGSCTCTSMSVETSCCIGALFYDCPSALTAGACFDDQEPGACQRDPSRDAACANRTNNATGTNNGAGMELDDPLCWANCRDPHEVCADSCGGGQTCWDLCEDDHDECARRCGGGDACRDRCDASPTECAGRCG